jgi:hypothetical protein
MNYVLQEEMETEENKEDKTQEEKSEELIKQVPCPFIII